MNGAACVCASDFHRRCGVAGHGWITPAMRHAAKSGRDVNEAKRLEQERLCACKDTCGDDGDTEGPGTCKGLPRAPEPPLVEIVLIPRWPKP